MHTSDDRCMRGFEQLRAGSVQHSRRVVCHAISTSCHACENGILEMRRGEPGDEIRYVFGEIRSSSGLAGMVDVGGWSGEWASGEACRH